MTDRIPPADVPPIHVQATRYEVSVFPEGADARRYFTITVEWRGADRWAVLDGPFRLGADGGWEYEPLTSERDEAWLAGHRFDHDTALRLAAEAAPGISRNGRTALEAWRAAARAVLARPTPAP